MYIGKNPTLGFLFRTPIQTMYDYIIYFIVIIATGDHLAGVLISEW